MTTRFVVAFPTRRSRRCANCAPFPPPSYVHDFLCFLFLLLINIFSYGVLVLVCQVMHAAAYHSQPPPVAKGHTDPLYASVGHLLSKACSNTCFTAAQAFAQLVQPTARFQLALDALLPILDSERSEVSGRLVALSAESSR